MMVTQLYRWFAQSACRYPGHPALEVRRRCFTYADLQRCADYLACRLAATQRSPLRRVAVLATRSPTAYAGYLAVLSVGATVVPLNPAFPSARNVMTAELCGIDAVIADDDGVAQLDAVVNRTNAYPIDMSGDRWQAGLTTACHPGEARMAGAEDLAYILFTSGSTGRPKGVPIQHINICSYIEFNLHRYAVSPGSRWSQNSELTFDASVLEMFLAWGGGGTLVVPQRRDLLALTRFLGDEAITHTLIVPSAVSLACRMRALKENSLPALRYTLFGAEELTARQALAWRAAAPSSRIENLYGPTELTISCAAYELPADHSRWPSTSNHTIPIGTIYPHMEYRIIGEDGRQRNIGELYVRGIQRFPGYLLGADNIGRFYSIDDSGAAPFKDTTPLTSAQWYRTGDRVAVEGGQLVFLGRTDQQIKLHGHRVELGDVEAALRGHPDVVEVAVIFLPSGENSGSLLAAYTGARRCADELRRIAESALPPYMLPHKIVWVPQLPQGANGKLNRRKLAGMITE
jgi:amino acid adenylation domain-containing protein